jgi:hypothetical protein
MYSEFEIRRQIDKIANGDDSPIRKARRLLLLSKRVGRFSAKVGHGADILEQDEDAEGAGRLMHTVDGLKRCQQEARLAAFNALKGEALRPLSFEVASEAKAFPIQWVDTKERLDAQLGYN